MSVYCRAAKSGKFCHIMPLLRTLRMSSRRRAHAAASASCYASLGRRGARAVAAHAISRVSYAGRVTSQYIPGSLLRHFIIAAHYAAISILLFISRHGFSNTCRTLHMLLILIMASSPFITLHVNYAIASFSGAIFITLRYCPFCFIFIHLLCDVPLAFISLFTGQVHYYAIVHYCRFSYCFHYHCYYCHCCIFAMFHFATYERCRHCADICRHALRQRFLRYYYVITPLLA